MARRQETIEQLDASIKKWKTRLKRSMTALDKLEKKRRRLVAKATVSAALDPVLEQLGALTIRPEPMIARKDVTMQDAQRAAADRVGDMIIDAGISAGLTPAQTLGLPEPKAGDLTIPDFLRRGVAAQKAADAVISGAAEQIRAEQAALKKAKAAGRIAKMKAKKAGDLKKMPLSGKAALAAIRGE